MTDHIIESDGKIVTEAGSLDLTEWNTKVDFRTKNRMKITFKLNQDQAKAYEQFRTVTKPDQISDYQFVTSIFFMGLAALEQQIIAQAQQTMEQDEEVDVDAIASEASEQEAE